MFGIGSWETRMVGPDAIGNGGDAPRCERRGDPTPLGKREVVSMYGDRSPRIRRRPALILMAVASCWAMGIAPHQGVEPLGVVARASATGARRPGLVHLPPGTRLHPDRPPSGWSRFVLKSTPVLSSGDLGTLGEEAFATARRIRLAILADVGREPVGTAYAIRRVGVGLAAPVVGEGEQAGDVIVAATNVGEKSGDWTTKERIILAAGSRELGRASLAAAAPTFALLRTPTTCLVGGRHETVDVMYAMLVEPGSGRLRLFACKPPVDGLPPVIRELNAPAIVDGPLDVKAKTLAGFAVSWSFAMVDVPEGIERPIPDELARLLSPENLESADPLAMEGAFRAFAKSPGVASRRDEGLARQGD